MLTEYARDSVRRLRVFALPGEALAARRSMEHALAGVELTPRGLASSAIVCVRRLRAERAPEHAGGWADGVRNQIAGMVAAGARPYRDLVPLDGAAVVFDDEAELLACLARDWQSGSGATWWWAGLLGGPPSAALVRRVFLAHARFVPAAIELLLESRRVSDVVRALTDEVCIELEQAVATAFGVPALPPPRPAPIHSGDRRHTEALRGDHDVPAEVIARAAAVVSLHGDTVVLSSAQRSFVAVSLLVRRAPVLAWTPGLVAALRETLTSQQIESRIAERHGAEEETTATAAPASISTEDSRPQAIATAEGAPAVTVHGPAAVRDATTSFTEPIGPPIAIADGANIDAPVCVPVRERATAGLIHLTEPSVEAFQTSFAGAFYLVNLAIQLEIFGDFTQPGRSPEVPLGRFLARIAEAACGEAVREDPIWQALARLSGEGEELWAETCGSAIDRTIDEMRPDLEALAARAHELPEGAALEWLCRTTGRVVIGRTRLDVFFALASHPIAIRIAGFDRNPGWVPAAGRVISFHYD